MEIIGAAALIAVGLVIAALVYGRTHRAGGVGRHEAEPAPNFECSICDVRFRSRIKVVEGL